MKKLLSLAIAITIVGAASVANAGGLSFLRSDRTTKIAPGQPGYMVAEKELRTVSFQPPPPAPGAEGTTPPPSPEPMGSPVGGGGCQLYHCVKYKDLDHIAPCAVPKIVSIVDPCWKPSKCGCCRPQPRCVCVKICAPSCGCPRVKVSDDGRKVKYDYGDYEVEIESKDGYVEVDYDD